MNIGMENGWRNAGHAVLDLLFPPLCIGCRTPVGDSGFCAACWERVAFLDGPACAACGAPFDLDPVFETLCAACHARAPAFDKARAIMRYDENSRAPILALKHADRLDLVPGFARWLERAGRALITESDLLVPVPLHPLRLWRRRYNQAAELARALGRTCARPVNMGVLARVRATPSQGAMVSARARARNVRGAFAVVPAHGDAVRGRNILLVDDVFTTGATAEACALALKRAGAARVHVLTLARVVRPQDSTI